MRDVDPCEFQRAYQQIKRCDDDGALDTIDRIAPVIITDEPEEWTGFEGMLDSVDSKPPEHWVKLNLKHARDALRDRQPGYKNVAKYHVWSAQRSLEGVGVDVSDECRIDVEDE